jgi:hypothetical protein
MSKRGFVPQVLPDPVHRKHARKNSEHSIISDNIYESLKNDIEDTEVFSDLEPENSANKNNKKVQKPPPLITFNIKTNEIIKLCEKNIVPTQEINFRITQFGTKVFTPDLETYKRLRDVFISDNVNFFTHQLKEEMTTKIVLYQLPRYSLEEVKEWLAEYKIQPLDVKYIKIKK